LTFVSARGDHAFIGVYDVAAKTVQFMAPSVDSDGDPVWSLDGKGIAFVRRPRKRETRTGLLHCSDKPQSLGHLVADASTGSAKEICAAARHRRDRFPTCGRHRGGVINWAAGNHW